jgi:hypothetical protein
MKGEKETAETAEYVIFLRSAQLVLDSASASAQEDGLVRGV